LSVGDFFKKIKKVVSVDIIQPLGWFIEYEQLRSFNKRPADEDQALFGKGKFTERTIAFVCKG